jgi:hypothetical protein
MMKKKMLLLLSLLIVSGFNVMAQEMTVSPAHVICDYQLSDKVDNQVKSKLQRALSKFGISSDPGLSRFAMVPEIIINNEQTRATIPAKCDIDFDFVVSLEDIQSGKIFASYSYNVQATGGNKANAITKGVSTLKLNDADFARFIAESKDKVITYYEAQIPSIVQRAKSAVSARNFQEAIYILCEVPTECPSYTSKVAPLIQEFYVKEMNLMGEKILAEARAAWAASPNEEGAAQVASILASMPPSCSSSSAAKSFVSSITTKVESIHQWERDYQVREQKYAHNEKLASIESARAIGVAYAQNQPKVVYNTRVHVWW